MQVHLHCTFTEYRPTVLQADNDYSKAFLICSSGSVEWSMYCVTDMVTIKVHLILNSDWRYNYLILVHYVVFSYNLWLLSCSCFCILAIHLVNCHDFICCT